MVGVKVVTERRDFGAKVIVSSLLKLELIKIPGKVKVTKNQDKKLWTRLYFRLRKKIEVYDGDKTT